MDATGKPKPLPAGLWQDGHAVLRCSWCQPSAAYRDYHDLEWGFPETSDQALFEKLCLEGFQAGLSWLTILNKRENFRSAFDGFDAQRIAHYGPSDIRRLLRDAGIVRHKGKILSAINNARRMKVLVSEFGSLCSYVWLFEPELSEFDQAPTRESLRRRGLPPQAFQLSSDLRRRGWTFIGPTTAYAFMQAMGLVNDHLDGCMTRAAARAARLALGYCE